MHPPMIFLSYTPRPDSDERGYEDWLRTVDNPFFNSQPPVAHYSNWKFTDRARTPPGFTHFDFMALKTGTTPAEIFGLPAVQQFVENWTRLWGRDPDGPPDRNCNCFALASEDLAETWSSSLVLSLDEPAARGSTWHVVGELIGRAPFRSLTRRYLQAGEASPGFPAELIAAP